MNNRFKLNESEKNRIRNLHGINVIKEQAEDEYPVLNTLADRLNKAIKGPGTNEDEIWLALEELATIAKSNSKWSGHKRSYLFNDLSDIYEASYGEKLWDALKGDLSVADLKRASEMTGKQVVWGGDHDMERTGYTP